MKLLAKIGFGLIVLLGFSLLSFTFSDGSGFQFLIASELGKYAIFPATLISILVFIFIRFFNKKQLLGISLFLLSVPFSFLHKGGNTTMIILAHHPIVGMILFALGGGVLFYRQVFSPA